ncbi:MAG: hypothetical protein ACXVB9_06500 [Bdellovibrionota bacterium]
MFFAGLLLGLGAMVAIFQAKRAMMPKFHEMPDAREDISMVPGGSIKFIYTDEPGYFLPPGFPSTAILYRKTEGGTYSSIMRLQYGDLTEKEPSLGPIAEEGTYSLAADLYICAEPGVADCAKLMITQNIKVERGAAASDDKLPVNLLQIAREGLRQGNPDDPRNKADEKEIEKPAE